jgi:hypothetical protein
VWVNDFLEEVTSHIVLLPDWYPDRQLSWSVYWQTFCIALPIVVAVHLLNMNNEGYD